MNVRVLVPSLLLGLLLVAGCAARQVGGEPPAPEQPVAAGETPAKPARAAKAPAEPSGPLADARARESELSDSDLATLRKNLGKDAFDQTGTAGWVDLPGLTAAHPSLPVGSKVEVTNLDNSKRTMVMVTDRGQNSGRIIDLSRTAAEQLGMSQSGTARVGLRVLDRPRGKAAQKAAKKAAAARPAPKPQAQAQADDSAVSPEDMVTADEAAAPASSKKKSAQAPAKGAAKAATAKTAAKAPAKPAAQAPAKAQAATAPAKAQAKAAGGKYYVQVGSFASPENAEKLVKRLKAQGFGGSRQVRAQTGGKVLYRVQAGSFPNKAAAEAALKTLKGEFPTGYVTGD